MTSTSSTSNSSVLQKRNKKEFNPDEVAKFRETTISIANGTEKGMQGNPERSEGEVSETFVQVPRQQVNRRHHGNTTREKSVECMRSQSCRSASSAKGEHQHLQTAHRQCQDSSAPLNDLGLLTPSNPRNWHQKERTSRRGNRPSSVDLKYPPSNNNHPISEKSKRRVSKNDGESKPTKSKYGSLRGLAGWFKKVLLPKERCSPTKSAAENHWSDMEENKRLGNVSPVRGKTSSLDILKSKTLEEGVEDHFSDPSHGNRFMRRPVDRRVQRSYSYSNAVSTQDKIFKQRPQSPENAPVNQKQHAKIQPKSSLGQERTFPGPSKTMPSSSLRMQSASVRSDLVTPPQPQWSPGSWSSSGSFSPSGFTPQSMERTWHRNRGTSSGSPPVNPHTCKLTPIRKSKESGETQPDISLPVSQDLSDVSWMMTDYSPQVACIQEEEGREIDGYSDENDEFIPTAEVVQFPAFDEDLEEEEFPRSQTHPISRRPPLQRVSKTFSRKGSDSQWKKPASFSPSLPSAHLLPSVQNSSRSTPINAGPHAVSSSNPSLIRMDTDPKNHYSVETYAKNVGKLTPRSILKASGRKWGLGANGSHPDNYYDSIEFQRSASLDPQLMRSMYVKQRKVSFSMIVDVIISGFPNA